MHQFGTKNLQVPIQLFQLVFNLLFEVGGFGSSVAEMNVHEYLFAGNAPAEATLF
jgi:hypothetical protein